MFYSLFVVAFLFLLGFFGSSLREYREGGGGWGEGEQMTTSLVTSSLGARQDSQHTAVLVDFDQDPKLVRRSGSGSSSSDSRGRITGG